MNKDLCIQPWVSTVNRSAWQHPEEESKQTRLPEASVSFPVTACPSEVTAKWLLLPLTSWFIFELYIVQYSLCPGSLLFETDMIGHALHNRWQETVLLFTDRQQGAQKPGIHCELPPCPTILQDSGNLPRWTESCLFMFHGLHSWGTLKSSLSWAIPWDKTHWATLSEDILFLLVAGTGMDPGLFWSTPPSQDATFPAPAPVILENPYQEREESWVSRRPSGEPSRPSERVPWSGRCNQISPH